MRLSLKTKQVAGVTLLVGLAVIISSGIYLAGIAHFYLEESKTGGDWVARTILQQADRVNVQDDVASALRVDPGLRATLQAALAYAPNVTYAAIVDRDGLAIAHGFPDLEGVRIPEQPLIQELLDQPVWTQLSAIYSARTFEVRERLFTAAGEEFGTIRVGLSMLLVQQALRDALEPALATTVAAIALALLLATLLANWILRPIAVVQTGLARLGRGEVDVKLELPSDDVFGELGQSFETVSARLAEARSQLAGQHLESAVDRLDDGVAVFSGTGDLLFANPAIRVLMGVAAANVGSVKTLPAAHPFRPLLDRALAERRTVGPETLQVPRDDGEPAEHHVAAHALWGHRGDFVGIMVVARNVAYRSEVQSTLRYSRKLASLNRLLAGVAHEVKNPLNAMTIHLELLKQKLATSQSAQGALAGHGRNPGPAAEATEPDRVLRHLTIIGQEIRRLDEVVQGFLKFSRPEDLNLKPVALRPLVEDVFGLVAAESSGRLTLRNDCPGDLPPILGDAPLLRQALLNLCLNACQAMPDGGMLSVRGRAREGSVEIEVADTGTGIPPENLGRIFNLYFTTREGGSGLGLAMVYRTVQLHDGTIEVESTIGHGTTFRIRLPTA